MTVQVTNEHAHFQKLVSVVKMAAVLEEYTIEDLRSFLCITWAKDLKA
jgi:hypothetical protein